MSARTDIEALSALEKAATPDNQGKYLLALRNAAPAMLDELRELREENAHLRGDDPVTSDALRELRRSRAELAALRRVADAARAYWHGTGLYPHDELDRALAALDALGKEGK